ncbi:reticulon-3 isoform X3 [Arapaima gigas]
MIAADRVQQEPGMASDGINASLHFFTETKTFTPVYHDDQVPEVVGECHFVKDKNNAAACGIDSPSSQVLSVLKSSGPVKSSTVLPRQNTSPVKTSPVSERIKALEALVAKQNDPGTRSDVGFLHFKERHFEKSPTDSSSQFQKKEVFPDHDSPESPFEVLGDIHRGSDFEDTVDWMRVHLPPAPNFETVPEFSRKGPSDFLLSEDCCDFEENRVATGLVAGIPDAFMDASADASLQKEPVIEFAKEVCVEEDSEFDINFLPTAYLWGKQERTGPVTQAPPASPPLPAGFGSPLPVPTPPALDLDTSELKPAPWISNTETPEVVDVESSGESDDTVIGDAVSVSAVQNPSSSMVGFKGFISVTPSITNEEKDVQSAEQLALVPIINVIETDEQPLSDEDESYEVVKDPMKEQPRFPSPESEVKLKGNTDSVTEGSIEKKSPDEQSLATSANSVPVSLEYQEQTSTTQVGSGFGTSLHDHPMTSQSQAQNEPTVFSTELLSRENNEYSSLSEKIDSFDVLQDHHLTENMLSPNELSDKSPFGIESAVIIMEESSHFIDQGEDPSKQTLSNFESDNDLSIERVNQPSVSLTSSLSDKPEPDAFQEDFLFNDNRLQKNPDYTECIPHSTKETNNEQLSKNIMVLPADLKLDYETMTSSSDMTLKWQTDVVLPLEVSESGNDPEVTPEDALSASLGRHLCTQNIPQNTLSVFSNSSADVQPELRELEQDNGYFVEGDSSNESEKLSEEPENLFEDDYVLPLESGSVLSAVVKQQNSQGEEQMPEISDPEHIEPECSVSAATDSFVEFMRECLKSQQEEDTIDLCTCYTPKMELPKIDASASPTPPATVLDLEQEHLTICALKELGSSQEDQDLPMSAKATQSLTGQKEKYPHCATEFQTTVTRTHPSESPPCAPPLEASTVEEVAGIDTWVADAFYLAEHVLAAILTHLSVKDLVYWRDPKKTGVVFGVSLLLLLSLATFSIISVISYLLLALLCVTISFRIYKTVIQAVQKSNEGHPFRAFMEEDISVPPETFRKHVDMCLSYINQALRYLSRLFLVEDLVDSLKLAVAMWLLTYVGAVFNGITILILVDVLVFTLPLVYEKNKTQIDNYVGIARTHFNTMVFKLREKLPGVKRKSE